MSPRELYIDEALRTPRSVEDIVRARNLAQLQPQVVEQLRNYAAMLHSAGRLATAQSVKSLIADLEGKSRG
jgi:hypothetical protein